MTEIQKIIEGACAQLEKTALRMDIQLAVDMAVIPALEDLVGAAVELGDEKALQGATFMIGAYLGETLRRRMGATWIATENGPPAVDAGILSFHPIERVRQFAAEAEEPGALKFYAEALVASVAR